jgi:hypothetical protein
MKQKNMEDFLSAYMPIFYFIFHMMIVSNILYTDTPEEDPLSLGLVGALLTIVGTGVLFSLHIKINPYQKKKKIIWSLFFIWNLLVCALWAFLIYRFNLHDVNDKASVLMATLVNAMLAVQIIFKKTSSNNNLKNYETVI